jgi:leucyl aminopeptidase
MNGKSVEVDNTDAEGRLILSGSYYYYFLVRGGS